MDTQLALEKQSMSKQELIQQNRFEQLINIMIMYKQQNPNIDVYLTEKNITKAIKWYQSNFTSMLAESIKSKDN
jgi:hypothetical protein|tara:strand:+ start:133 stop:354 length:222 start_codon:yes stop_codon:yes gene_type:complete